jgi:hypothetical protein
MQVVYEATQVTDTQVKGAGLQCLVKIMPLYYQHMEFYTENAAKNRTEDSKEPETNALSAYFRPIVDKLLATTDRADGNQANLRPAAYEAFMELTKNSRRDCYETVQHTTVIILERLKTVLIMENQNNAGDRTQFNELQSVLRKGEYKYKNGLFH